MTDSIERDWLLVQTLIIKRRFVEVLTLLQKIEISYSSDPETPFAANYYRAQAMIGLGQKEQAIVILQSLLNVRPNYRSTKSILNSLSRGHGFR